MRCVDNWFHSWSWTKGRKCHKMKLREVYTGGTFTPRRGPTTLAFGLIRLLECFLYLVYYHGISEFLFCVVFSMLISFKESGKFFTSACLTKTSILLSFWSKACPLTCTWRAAVFWPWKGSIIINYLIMIWYEWPEVALAVLGVDLLIEFGLWVKILRRFYGGT